MSKEEIFEEMSKEEIFEEKKYKMVKEVTKVLIKFIEAAQEKEKRVQYVNNIKQLVKSLPECINQFVEIKTNSFTSYKKDDLTYPLIEVCRYNDNELFEIIYPAGKYDWDPLTKDFNTHTKTHPLFEELIFRNHLDNLDLFKNLAERKAYINFKELNIYYTLFYYQPLIERIKILMETNDCYHKDIMNGYVNKFLKNMECPTVNNQELVSYMKQYIQPISKMQEAQPKSQEVHDTKPRANNINQSEVMNEITNKPKYVEKLFGDKNKNKMQIKLKNPSNVKITYIGKMTLSVNNIKNKIYENILSIVCYCSNEITNKYKQKENKYKFIEPIKLVLVTKDYNTYCFTTNSVFQIKIMNN